MRGGMEAWIVAVMVVGAVEAREAAGEASGVVQASATSEVDARLSPAAYDALGRAAVYRSQRWRASFHYERVRVPGIDEPTGAARVVAIDESSPLRRMGLEVGDLVTRLDEQPVGAGKWPDQELVYWVLPEFERHFGETEVRFVKRLGGRVESRRIDLGQPRRPAPADGPATP